MASFKVNIDNDFIKKVTNLGKRSDLIIQRMLDDTSQILGDALEGEIRSKHTQGSGELADSIEVTSPYKNKAGLWTVGAYPTGRSKKMMHNGKVYSRSKHGTRSKGEVLYNADKLFFIEYGRSGQAAQPFIDKLTNDIHDKVMDNMQEVFDREVEKM